MLLAVFLDKSQIVHLAELDVFFDTEGENNQKTGQGNGHFEQLIDFAST